MVVADVDEVSRDFEVASQTLLANQSTSKEAFGCENDIREQNLRRTNQLFILVVLVPHLEQKVLCGARVVVDLEAFDPLGIEIVVHSLCMALVNVHGVLGASNFERAERVTLRDDVQVSQVLA